MTAFCHGLVGVKFVTIRSISGTLRPMTDDNVLSSHLVQAHFQFNEAVASGGGLEAGDEAALRVLHGQHAAEELRVHHGSGWPAGPPGPSRTPPAPPPPLRWAPGTGADAGRPRRYMRRGATGSGSNRTARPPGRRPPHSAHTGKNLPPFGVRQQVSELDRHAWLAAHPPFLFPRKKMPPAGTHLLPHDGGKAPGWLRKCESHGASETLLWPAHAGRAL